MLAACYFNTHRVQVPLLDKPILSGSFCCSSLISVVKCAKQATTHTQHTVHTISTHTQHKTKVKS